MEGGIMRPLILLVALVPLWAQDVTESRNWVNIGVQAFRSAQYPEAVRDFQKALDLDPSFTTARLYLATAYMQQYIPSVDTPENREVAANAEGNFKKALELDPANRVAMTSIASLNLNQKKWDDAQQWYEKLIAADSANADAYYSLGFIAWSKWYPAYQQARATLGMKPEDPGPIWDLDTKQDLRIKYGGILGDGIANLQKAVELNPQYADAMLYMNQFIRERADLADTPEEYSQDIEAADRLVQKALVVNKRKAEGDVPSRIRVGASVMEAKLIHRVDPVYAPLALQARIAGDVKLNVTISKEGTVSNIMVISGHPLLIPSAVEAVKQWLYQPMLLNGAPVEVATEVHVPFNLPQ
jgi:TonB family protein